MNSSVFWDHVDRSGGPDACWPWAGARISGDYGQLRCGSRRILAHRMAFSLAVGDIPQGALILHSCDNPICCNPGHLRAGNRRDNTLDSVVRGRWHPSIFTADQVAVIRSSFEAGEGSIRQLAARYGVNYSTIRKIVARRSYREVSDGRA